MAFVRTVLGDLDPAELGPTDYHEHLFQTTPLLPGEDLDDEASSGAEAGSLRDSGFAAMVDATPLGLGRRPASVAAISLRSRIHVVATTGAHREEHYEPGHWLLAQTEQELAARFLSDIEAGMAQIDGAEPGLPARGPSGAPVRAGMLKAGIGYWRMTAFERRVLAAVAVAHRSTGSPVMVHLEYGSAAFEVLAELSRDGVPASSVVLAHVDRNPDPALHAELAAAGAYLGYDGFARTRNWPDSTLLDCLGRVAALGGGNRILLGGDVARRSRYRAYGGMPGLEYLGRRVVPQLRRRDADLTRQVLVDNPARLLSLATPNHPS